MANPNAAPVLPPHIEETIQSIARLHAQHHQNATSLQRAVDRITAFVGRPRFIGILTLIAVAWISLNSAHCHVRLSPFRSASLLRARRRVPLVSLYIVVLILATQRREYQLAQLREQLTLELAILSEQKTAKVIQLLEESRCDNPLIRDRVDREAELWPSQPTRNQCSKRSRVPTPRRSGSAPP